MIYIIKPINFTQAQIRPFIEMVSNHCNTIHHNIILNERDLVDSLDNAVIARDHSRFGRF
jgi:hypothetical protein